MNLLILFAFFSLELTTNVTLSSPSPSPYPLKVISGHKHSCAIKNQELQCWGLNNAGQLGVGHHFDLATPTKVLNPTGTGPLKKVIAAALGQEHTCALTDDGVFCWGDPTYTGVTAGTVTPDHALPVRVFEAQTGLPLPRARSIQAGFTGTCAIMSADNSLRCWGQDIVGELGGYQSGLSYQLARPVIRKDNGQILTGVRSVSMAYHHSCALLTDGKVYCWGSNREKQMGEFGFTNTQAIQITPPASPLTLRDVTVGRYATLYNYNLSVLSWGKIIERPLHDLNPIFQSSTSIAIIDGRWETYCISNLGKVSCVGNGQYGQLGNKTFSNSAVPVAVVSPTGSGILQGVSELSVGDDHVCAVSYNEVYCWGSNEKGQLAQVKTLTRAHTPQKVSLIP